MTRSFFVQFSGHSSGGRIREIMSLYERGFFNMAKVRTTVEINGSPYIHRSHISRRTSQNVYEGKYDGLMEKDLSARNFMISTLKVLEDAKERIVRDIVVNNAPVAEEALMKLSDAQEAAYELMDMYRDPMPRIMRHTGKRIVHDMDAAEDLVSSITVTQTKGYTMHEKAVAGMVLRNAQDGVSLDLGALREAFENSLERTFISQDLPRAGDMAHFADIMKRKESLCRMSKMHEPPDIGDYVGQARLKSVAWLVDQIDRYDRFHPRAEWRKENQEERTR